MNYWIGWRGGERPVPHDTLVGVLFRSGQTAVGPCSEFGWQHSKSVIRAHADSDIIAYYVVPQNPVPDMVNNPPHYTDGGIEDQIKWWRPTARETTSTPQEAAKAAWDVLVEHKTRLQYERDAKMADVGVKMNEVRQLDKQIAALDAHFNALRGIFDDQ